MNPYVFTLLLPCKYSRTCDTFFLLENKFLFPSNGSESPGRPAQVPPMSDTPIAVSVPVSDRSPIEFTSGPSWRKDRHAALRETPDRRTHHVSFSSGFDGGVV